MHIFLAAFALLCGIAYLVFGRRKPGPAAAASGHRAGTPPGGPGDTPLETLDDPRAAAAALMLSLAEAKGPVNAAISLRLREEFETVLGAEDSDQLLAHARYLIRGMPQAEAVAARVAPIFNERLSEPEKADLINMLKRIARNDPEQMAVVDGLRSKLGM